MNQATPPDRHAIVIDDVFPHTPEIIWKALTTGALMSRWLMAPNGFEPVVGCRFTFQTKPAGEWDGTISCEILEIVANERLSFAWKGGHANNSGYGSKLETIVTFTLTQSDNGTRLRLVHSGFALPRNEVAYGNMSEGWKTVVKRLDAVVTDESFSTTSH
jgi:uncharacterized protein YndB with AHSA1/START domain